jgi:hypothetical protein
MASTKLNGLQIEPVLWEELAPNRSLRLIKDIVSTIDIFSNDRRTKTPSQRWLEIGPLIKKKLKSGQLRLRRARFDLANFGSPQTIYSLSILPKDTCKQAGGGTGIGMTYLYIDKSSPLANSWNAQSVAGEPFEFGGTSYLLLNDEIQELRGRELGAGKLGRYPIERCVFQRN